MPNVNHMVSLMVIRNGEKGETAKNVNGETKNVNGEKGETAKNVNGNLLNLFIVIFIFFIIYIRSLNKFDVHSNKLDVCLFNFILY
jgi:hypothetical protein